MGNLLVASESFRKPLLRFEQPKALCAQLTRPQVDAARRQRLRPRRERRAARRVEPRGRRELPRRARLARGAADARAGFEARGARARGLRGRGVPQPRAEAARAGAAAAGGSGPRSTICRVTSRGSSAGARATRARPAPSRCVPCRRATEVAGDEPAPPERGNEMAQRLPVGEKVGYALGDMAANFVFQFMIALQLDFYTHTFGLTPAQAGTMLGVVGLGVAVLNPVMGVIADRTTSRWGKFRPWILWSAAAVRHHRRADLHDAGPRPRRQGDLRLGDLHRAAGGLHRQQRAVRVAHGRDDRGSRRADEHLLVPPDRREHGGPHHRELRRPARRHPRPGQRRARLPAHDGPALGRERRLLRRSPSSSRRSASSPTRSRRPRSPRTCRTCSATGPS